MAEHVYDLSSAMPPLCCKDSSSLGVFYYLCIVSRLCFQTAGSIERGIEETHTAGEFQLLSNNTVDSRNPVILHDWQPIGWEGMGASSSMMVKFVDTECDDSPEARDYHRLQCRQIWVSLARPDSSGISCECGESGRFIGGFAIFLFYFLLNEEPFCSQC